MFDNVKPIYFRTLLGNQQILWLILTKVKLTLNKPFIFLILLSTPPDINDSTPANQKKKQNRKTFTWESVHASKATLWRVINLFTKSCKTNALFLIANLCLSKRYVSFFVSLCCSAHQKHHFSLQKQLLTDDHGSFKQTELFFLFSFRIIATERIYVSSACSMANLGMCCRLLNVAHLFIIYKTQSAILVPPHWQDYA